MVTYTWVSAVRRWTWRVKVMLSYIGNWRPASDPWDPAPKKQNARGHSNCTRPGWQDGGVTPGSLAPEVKKHRERRFPLRACSPSVCSVPPFSLCFVWIDPEQVQGSRMCLPLPAMAGGPSVRPLWAFASAWQHLGQTPPISVDLSVAYQRKLFPI